ncbi:MAG TPA: beta-propeller fold lactonase family protein [Candidatus Sulfotelmatobacter sp.]
MQTNSLPFSFRIFILLVLAWAVSVTLSACGGGGRSVVCRTPPCKGEQPLEFLYATSTSGQILGMPVDPATGAVVMSTSVATGPAVSLGITAVGSQFVYASDFQSNQIYGYSIDQTNGALAPIGGSPFSEGPLGLPNGLVAGPGGNLLYATAGIGVDGFSLSSAGVPALIAGSPFLSDGNLELAIDPSGKFLFAPVLAQPGGVFAFTIDATTGMLTVVPGSPFPFSGQKIPNSNPVGIVVDSTGQFVYVALGSANQVAAFSITSGTGALTPVPGSPFSGGTKPFLLATTGKFLYVSNAGDGTVSGYSIDSTSGVLTALAGSPYVVATASLVADPAGKFLFGAGGAGIYAFTINVDGSLSPVSGSPFPEAEPVILTIVEIR